MIRTIVMLAFWGIAAPIASLILIPWTLLTGDVRALYRVCMSGASAGVWLAGVRVEIIGREKLDPEQTYVFMSNHASNIDPPLMLPLIPKRTSVMAKKELFSYPLLGKIMTVGELVPVDRGNRDAGIAAVRAATEVVRRGVNMTIYVEGKRSFDGKLLPFKKGPFYLAEACNVPVVPVTISGTHYVMPKQRFAIRPGLVQVIFHDPIAPQDFGSRDCLMEKVKRAIDSGLAETYRESSFTIRDSKAR
jgi:1-acyl-sn-glycerol-3-phosphate acyltransferase